MATGPVVPPGFLTRSGRTLVLDGVPRQLVGVNAYSIATDWSFNPGCGRQADVEATFASLPPDTLVRFWAFQPLATDRDRGAPNFAAFDRIVAAAERHGQKLIVVLGNHWGTCDGGPGRSASWYDGGYASTYGDTRQSPLPYLDYVRSVVTRYRESPAVGMWELLNEPEIPCDRAPVLRRFFDVVGGEVKRLDPFHLMSSGVIGSGQCGTSGNDYRLLHESPAIDVASYHDYDDPRPIPGDQWNGMSVRLWQAQGFDKPLIVGEVGLPSGGSGCMTPTERRNAMRTKVDGQLAAGVQAVVLWAWIFEPPTGCAYEFNGNDPILEVVRAGVPRR